MEKMIQLTLPEFAFVEGYRGKDDEMYGRNVILHVRSASVIEVFERGNAFLNEDVITCTFTMRLPRITNPTEMAEMTFVLALHHSPLLDVKADRELIMQEIMKPAEDYWRDYQMYVYEQAKLKHTAMLDIMNEYEDMYFNDDDEFDFFGEEDEFDFFGEEDNI